MASFRGLYDKLVSFVFDSNKDDDYNPVSSDYVAVFDSYGPRNIDSTATWMPKKYVPVTTIGSGGGGGGSMSSFYVTGVGGITLSLDNTNYSEGPLTVTNNDNISINSTSVPNGLNWTGPYNSGTTYSINDVVSTNYTSGGNTTYSTWWCQQNGTVNQAPPNNATYNTYWVQLGTQGPAGGTGPQGAQGATGAAATQNFRIVNNASATVLANGSSGTDNNDRGSFIYMANGTATTTVTIPLDLSTNQNTGFPLFYQTSVIKAGTGGSVQIIGETVEGNSVTVRSADGANYLRTQFSSCTLVRKGTNEWVMFGDLTNIA
jgi:hypothetical protein